MIRVYFALIIIFLAMEILAPNAFARRPLTQTQARQRAYQITQTLRKENPLVLRWVLHQMGWVPKIKYTKERKQQQESEQVFDDWYIDMMRSMGGL
tara:strand:+ start:2565 stop:2852 length:288 start_codon:yes stop_codon:yes gene_type:complete